MQNFNLPALLGGAGLRHEHFEQILSERPEFRWFEIITENFLDFGGAARESLFEIAAHYQIIGHGVCLSVGSTDELDLNFLRRLKQFLREIRSPWYSDHLCFTMVDHTNLNELIPLPFTTAAVENCVERIKVIQDTLELPFLVENVTRYMTVSDREMNEAEFITRIIEGANCGLLLDLTNVTLNAKFHAFDAWNFVKSLPLERVGQIHLAGWEPDGDQIIDSHDAPVPEEVWQLFQKTIELIGPTSVLVEWDASLPPMQQLLDETRHADKIILQSTRELAA